VSLSKSLTGQIYEAIILEVTYHESLFKFIANVILRLRRIADKGLQIFYHIFVCTSCMHITPILIAAQYTGIV